MAKPKIIVKPKRIDTRKQRKTSLDTDYLLDENKKVHKTVDNELITISSVMPISVKQKKKKTKKEYAGRKKNRKKTRENKRTKRLQGQHESKKRKISKHTPLGIESKPTTPIGIESKSGDDDYIPTVDIFEIIEDYIMSIPTYIETWKKHLKGHIIHDMQPFKMSLVSLLRDYSMSEDKEVEKYFKNNEYAIKECIDAFHAISTNDDIYTLENKLVSLINMGHALSADSMNYLELLEN